MPLRNGGQARSCRIGGDGSSGSGWAIH